MLNEQIRNIAEALKSILKLASAETASAKHKGLRKVLQYRSKLERNNLLSQIANNRFSLNLSETDKKKIEKILGITFPKTSNDDSVKQSIRKIPLERLKKDTWALKRLFMQQEVSGDNREKTMQALKADHKFEAGQVFYVHLWHKEAYWNLGLHHILKDNPDVLEVYITKIGNRGKSGLAQRGHDGRFYFVSDKGTLTNSYAAIFSAQIEIKTETTARPTITQSPAPKSAPPTAARKRQNVPNAPSKTATAPKGAPPEVSETIEHTEFKEHTVRIAPGTYLHLVGPKNQPPGPAEIVMYLHGQEGHYAHTRFGGRDTVKQVREAVREDLLDKNQTKYQRGKGFYRSLNTLHKKGRNTWFASLVITNRAIGAKWLEAQRSSYVKKILTGLKDNVARISGRSTSSRLRVYGFSGGGQFMKYMAEHDIRGKLNLEELGFTNVDYGLMDGGYWDPDGSVFRKVSEKGGRKVFIAYHKGSGKAGTQGESILHYLRKKGDYTRNGSTYKRGNLTVFKEGGKWSFNMHRSVPGKYFVHMYEGTSPGQEVVSSASKNSKKQTMQSASPEFVRTFIDNTERIKTANSLAALKDLLSLYPFNPDDPLIKIPGQPGIKARLAVAWRFLLAQKTAKLLSGTNIGVSSGYRSYDSQYRMWKKAPHRAARPGTSRHQSGAALDLDYYAADGSQIKLLPYMYTRTRHHAYIMTPVDPDECLKRLEEKRNQITEKQYKGLRITIELARFMHPLGFKNTVNGEPWHWEPRNPNNQEETFIYKHL